MSKWMFMSTKTGYGLAGIVFCMLGACSTGAKLEEARGQVTELGDKNRQLMKTVNTLQQELAGCTTNYNGVQEELAREKSDKVVLERKLALVQSVLKEQDAIMEELDEKIETALADFHDKGVDVYFRKGLVHVSMEDNLLYKSGSSKLTPAGKQALGHLAGVLNGYPDLKIVVLGNTDDVKFKNGIDNWTLSTERANGVVRVLNDDFQVNPVRLTAAGKGKYNPVADNATEAGRARNRRTDIILNPDFEKFWQSIER